MNVLLLSTDREICVPGSRAHMRMRAYAKRLTELHVVVLCPVGVGGSELQVFDSLSIYSTHSRSRVHMLFDAYRVAARILNTHTIDVVSSQDPFELGLLTYILTRRSKAKPHLQIHGDFFSTSYWRVESLRNRFRYYIGRFCISRIPRIRVVSERIAVSLVSLGVEREHISVLPIHADLSNFVCSEERVFGKEMTYLYAGRLEREKNLPLLIRAFAMHRAHHTGRVLEIVGRGREERSLRLLTESLGIEKHVRFIPWTDDLASCMRGAHLVLLSSNYEGYGMVIAEALVSGIPVVTTDVGCAGDLVEDGVEGRVVPVGNDGAFLEALDAVVKDRETYEGYQSAAQKRGKSLLTLTFDEYVDAWVSALGER